MSLFGGVESIWDSAAESLFFGHSGVAKLLDDGTASVPALLKEDDIIQEAQSQSPALIELCVAPQRASSQPSSSSRCTTH